MPLKIVRNNILDMEVDAIINPTDYKLSGSGSIDKKIHDAGGELMRKECDEYNHCDFGDAVLTHAYNLKCKYIIHTVGPFWRNEYDDLDIMKSCYTNCLLIAKQQKFKSIAFPLIGTGSFGCPKDLAINTAINTINSFLIDNEMKIYLVLYTSDAVEITSKLTEDIKVYINDKDVEEDRRLEEYLKLQLKERKEFYEYRNIPLFPTGIGNAYISKNIEVKQPTTDLSDGAFFCSKFEKTESSKNIPSLEEFNKNKNLLKQLNELEDTFGSRILKYIDEFGFTDSEVYTAACITRQVFQRVKNDENLSKKTVLALCVTLPLNLSQVEELLNAAGYSLSKSNKFDRYIKLLIKSMEGRDWLISIQKLDHQLYEIGLDTFTKSK